jgi:hypothetical protein
MSAKVLGVHTLPEKVQQSVDNLAARLGAIAYNLDGIEVSKVSLDVLGDLHTAERLLGRIEALVERAKLVAPNAHAQAELQRCAEMAAAAGEDWS